MRSYHGQLMRDVSLARQRPQYVQNAAVLASNVFILEVKCVQIVMGPAKPLRAHRIRNSFVVTETLIAVLVAAN